MRLEGKTALITGAGTGIGEATAILFAEEGADVVATDLDLDGAEQTAAAVRSRGRRALGLAADIADPSQVPDMVDKAIGAFGGIDILVNNASAISLTGTLQTPMKRFDLMFGVNVRGTYAASQALLPYLLKAKNPHILTLSPPLSMDPKWFGNHCAYTMAKYGMSMCVLGMAEEFRGDGVAVNALWPRTVIATAALAMIPGVELRNCRKPEIVADAANGILTRDSRACTGNFFLDDEVLAAEGVTDLSRYAVEPGAPLLPDLFLG
jgi:citronellol/citronellal dehydrogenase